MKDARRFLPSTQCHLFSDQMTQVVPVDLKTFVFRDKGEREEELEEVRLFYTEHRDIKMNHWIIAHPTELPAKRVI